MRPRRRKSPSLHSNASSSREEVAGGFFFEFEAVPTIATRDPHAGIGKEKRTFGFIKDSFKNMQGGMLADSSFLKNIFYFSKYEKDMINDETIEFMRFFGVLTWCGAFHATRI